MYGVPLKTYKDNEKDVQYEPHDGSHHNGYT